MTEQTNALDQNQEQQVDELTVLKQQAAMMGITHSNNITVETLRKKIADKLDDKSEEPESTATPAANALTGETSAPASEADATEPKAPVRKLTLAQHLHAEAMRLVRIRISSMDPKKQDLEGEIFTVANEYIGTVRKYVPFGEKTDKGFHVPYCIYQLLKSREFLHVQTREKNGQLETKTRYVKEFAIELLPDLTPAELKALAADQRATGRLDSDDE